MPKVIKVILSLSRLDKTRRLHNIRRHPHISSQEHSPDKRRHPSDSGSTGRQKDSHARQGNTQLSSSQHCGSMIVPWGAVGPTMAVGVYKPPHAPERGMGRPPHDNPVGV
eukprot:scaffold87_cov167-Isochrysis_galbana.AAC.2